MHFALRVLLIAGFNCLISCKHAYIAVRQQPDLLSVTASTSQKNPVKDYLQPFKDSLSQFMDIPLAQASGPLIKERPAGSLGNLFCDALLAVARKNDSSVLLFISNYGGLRVNRWPEGVITTRNVYELMPFDNSLVILTLPGSVLIKWMKHMSKMGGWPVGGACVIADTVHHNYQLSSCQSLWTITVDEKMEYRIATSDYVANGGDRCDFLIGQTSKVQGLLLRDALLQYLKENQHIVPNNENRFTFQIKP